jgi:hypothetical protein
MAFMVLVLSVLPLFTGLSFIVVATFFDRDPASKNIEAKASVCDGSVTLLLVV